MFFVLDTDVPALEKKLMGLPFFREKNVRYFTMNGKASLDNKIRRHNTEDLICIEWARDFALNVYGSLLIRRILVT